MKYWLLGAVMGAFGTGILFPLLVAAQTTTPKLFFSEYVEGSSNNKALEIYNPTASNVEINSLKLEKYVNGSATATNITLPLYNLESEKTFVLCDDSAAQAIKDKCNFQTGSLNFNGDDALALKDGAGNILDVFGQVGIDPGTAWGSGTASTVDHTLVRKCEIYEGDVNGSDAFDPSTEWNGYAVDTITDLGQHTTCYTTTITPTPILPTDTPAPTIEPTEVPEATPTDTLEETPTPLPPTSTPTTVPTNTPEPTVEPTGVIADTPTPRITPKPDRYGFYCEQTYLKIKLWRRTIELPLFRCHFSPLH